MQAHFSKNDEMESYIDPSLTMQNREFGAGKRTNLVDHNSEHLASHHESTGQKNNYSVVLLEDKNQPQVMEIMSSQSSIDSLHHRRPRVDQKKEIALFNDYQQKLKMEKV